MSYFIDVILPIPVEKAFTYAINKDEAIFLKPGMRVAVPFGKSKIYSGIVRHIHQEHPQIYEPKPIAYILDEHRLVTTIQLQLWEWIAQYYMCTPGEILRAAMPRTFLLESQTIIRKKGTLPDSEMDDASFMLMEALEHQSQLKIEEVIAILGKRKVLPIIDKLLHKGALSVQEEVYEKYTPKLVSYVSLTTQYEEESALNQLLDGMGRAPKQRQLILSFFSLKAKSKKEIKSTQLLKQAEATSAQLQVLKKKMFAYFMELPLPVKPKSM